jgi:putative membrane protein
VIHHGAPGVAGQGVALVGLAAALAYTLAAARLRARGDRWPAAAQAAFLAGCLALGVAGLTPGLAAGPRADHMVRHLLVGMLGPLLLVLGRPVTLALRAMPTGPARRGVLRLTRSRVAVALLCPPIAAALDAGGLWALYRTPLLAAAESRPWLAALVQAHVLLAGLAFTAAVCQLDPVRRRYGVATRSAALVAAAAAHAILAKTLWAAAPTADARAAAQVMYYGGDLTELGLAAVVALGWYAAAGRAQRRAVSAFGSRPVW